MECDCSDGVNTTKETSDGLIKLPKILEDKAISNWLNSTAASPNLAH